MSGQLLENSQSIDVQFIEIRQSMQMEEQVSPFKGIRWLLRIYSGIGILPTNCPGDCKSFTVQKWRYALAPALCSGIFFVSNIVGYVKHGFGGFYNTFNEDGKFTNLGKIQDAGMSS